MDDTNNKIQCGECKEWYDKFDWEDYERTECSLCGAKSVFYDEIIERNKQRRREGEIKEIKESSCAKVKTLKVIADISMLIGIVLAIVIWVVNKETSSNVTGIISGFVILFGTIVNWGVLRVICVIADNIIMIKENSDKANKNKK